MKYLIIVLITVMSFKSYAQSPIKNPNALITSNLNKATNQDILYNTWFKFDSDQGYTTLFKSIGYPNLIVEIDCIEIGVDQPGLYVYSDIQNFYNYDILTVNTWHNLQILIKDKSLANDYKSVFVALDNQVVYEELDIDVSSFNNSQLLYLDSIVIGANNFKGSIADFEIKLGEDLNISPCSYYPPKIDSSSYLVYNFDQIYFDGNLINHIYQKSDYWVNYNDYVNYTANNLSTPSFINTIPQPSPCLYTYVPDDFLENKLINLGYDNILNDYVLTQSIDTVTSLNLSGCSIKDFTGLQDMISINNLVYQFCSDVNQASDVDIDGFYNAISQINSLKKVRFLDYPFDYVDLSQLNNLQIFDFDQAGLVDSIDFSNNSEVLDIRLRSENHLLEYVNLQNCSLLERADFGFNKKLKSLNVGGLSSLRFLSLSACDEFDNIENIAECNNLDTFKMRLTKIKELDLSNNSKLTYVDLHGNDYLECLNLKNGNSSYMFAFSSLTSPRLFCIEVDDPTIFEQKFNSNIDDWTSLSTSCNKNCSLVSTFVNDDFETYFNIYPSPATSSINLVGLSKNDQVKIINNLGQILFVGELDGSDNTIDLTTFETGVYTVILNDTKHKKFIKVK